MNGGKRLSLILFLLVAGTAIATIALAARGQAEAPGQTPEPKLPSRTLHLVERGGGLRIVDNAPKARHAYDFSPGDMVIVTRDVFSSRGKRVGSLRLACTAITPTVQQCTGTESLAGGTLEVAAGESATTTTAAAIVGGTGMYAGARGTSLSRDRKSARDVADQTIVLLP